MAEEMSSSEGDEISPEEERDLPRRPTPEEYERGELAEREDTGCAGVSRYSALSEEDPSS